MEITWYGRSCFRMTERGTLAVVTDPFDEQSTGDTLPRLRADVVSVSCDLPDHNRTEAVSAGTRGDVRVVSTPGEYEMGGVFITGASMRNEKLKPGFRSTAFSFDFDGLRVVHLGGLGFVPSQQQIDALETVDVLIVPIGGGDCLTAAQAAEVVSLIEPSIVIPMNYSADGTAAKLDNSQKFLKEMGLTEAKPIESLKVTKNQLPEDTLVVLLDVKR